MYWFLWGFPSGASGKEPACQCRRHKRIRFDPWVRKILWRRAWQPTLVLLPGESQGQRSLEGYRPWGQKELDTAEAITHTCIHVYLFLWGLPCLCCDFGFSLLLPVLPIFSCIHLSSTLLLRCPTFKAICSQGQFFHSIWWCDRDKAVPCLGSALILNLDQLYHLQRQVGFGLSLCKNKKLD